MLAVEVVESRKFFLHLFPYSRSSSSETEDCYSEATTSLLGNLLSRTILPYLSVYCIDKEH